ncbi:hypothetical protein, partial [Vibrio parahaemolyticus]|uniref:hypothetical protein n=1 Tax=Vibrio parahaemolyticus TaxID=670 RepID=UPI001A7E38A7
IVLIGVNTNNLDKRLGYLVLCLSTLKRFVLARMTWIWANYLSRRQATVNFAKEFLRPIDTLKNIRFSDIYQVRF